MKMHIVVGCDFVTDCFVDHGYSEYSDQAGYYIHPLTPKTTCPMPTRSI
jgi:hypothetical protein